MSDEIVINGKTVRVAQQEDDASGSDYILIRTTGEPLNKAQKNELKALGVRIQEFVGNEHEQIYLCGYRKTSLDKIRGLEYINYVNVYSQDFVVPDVMQVVSAQAAEHEHDNTVEVDILLQHDIEQVSTDIVNKISKAADVNQSAISVDSGLVRVKVDAGALEKIASLDEVRVIHPTPERTVFNNVARQLLRLDAPVINDTPYKGEGEIVCVADTGFDTGSLTDVHDAFTGRIKQLHAWGRAKDNLVDDPDGHGTHVCGSVLGQGQHNSQGEIEGAAPAANLIVQSMFVKFNYLNQSVLGGYPKNLGQLFDQAYQAGARIHTNSWGTPLPRTGVQRPYDTSAESIDRYLWYHQDMTILFAAGNDGQDPDLDGTVNEKSLGAEASAKNCITVGASESYRPELVSGKEGAYTYGAFWPNKFSQNPLKDDHQANNPEGLAAFSSRGPSAENRLKPDVVAPGTAILSARSRKKKFLGGVDKSGKSDDDRYMYLSGTSMATPLVAGCCAVIRESLMKNGYQDEEENGVKNPTGSLVKALIINGAVPITGQYMPDDVGSAPNSHSGFGRVDIANSIAVVNPNDKFSGYGIGAIEEETEAPFVTEIPVPAAAAGNNELTLKVTMTYADLSGAALSNDLNLVVIAGKKQRHGNQLDQEYDVGAIQPFDRRNNVEQIVWPRVSGDHVQIVVKHFRLLSDRVPFAYAWKFY